MRRPPLTIVLAACAVAGAALGAGGAALLQGGTAEASSPLPVVARAPLPVLERPQRPADLQDVPGTPGLRRSSLRRVGALAAGQILLVGADTAGGRCIVAVAPGSSLFAAGCVPASAFGSGGARVAWSLPGRTHELTAEWSADGTVRAGDLNGAVQAGAQNVAQ